ncbi:MAG: hypothetical protein QXG03_05855 [Halalkalicoccus sp.]
MRLFGSRIGTAAWLCIGLGTAALAVVNDDRVTALIAVGWLVLAAFSWAEYRKSKR